MAVESTPENPDREAPAEAELGLPFRKALENVALIALGLDRDGCVTFANDFLLELTGWSRAEVIGNNWFTLFEEDPVVRADYARFMNEGAVRPHFQGPIRTRSGELREISWSNTLQLDAARDVSGVIAIGEDVTEQRRLQEQLIHAQKLEAVGRLAGGIAHDFNNLLTAIGGYADFLDSSFEDGDPRREDAREIILAAERAAALTRQLLAFSRRQVLKAEVLDLGEILGSLDKLLSRLLGEDVELVTTLEEGCLVRADRGQLEQVVTNLAVNARDAMPDGGRLELAVRCVDDQVELFVCDTGHGMDPEILPYIFEPFFTTKPAGKGTGLGLATVYGIVAQSGGEISVVSELDRGTTFRVVLPLAVDDRTPKAARTAVPAERKGTECILLAEDEETIRRLVCEVLIRQGYTVHAEPTGDAALEWFREHADDVDLLLTDVVMPGTLNGPALARAALAIKPSLRVLYTSGYANEPDEALESPDIAFIGKPFLPQELVAKVREVLDGG